MTGLEGEDTQGGFVRGLADGDGHRRRGRLQPRCDVNGVPRQEAFARRRVNPKVDQRLAGVDADAHLERRAADAGEGVYLVHETQRRPDRPLRIVLVCDRHAEHADHGVPDELLHGAAVGLDNPLRGSVVPPERRVHDLRVVPLAERCEADDVAEEGGDGAAFFHCPPLSSSRGWHHLDGDRQALAAAHHMELTWLPICALPIALSRSASRVDAI